MRPIASDGADVAALAAAFGRGQKLGREQRGGTRRAEEDDIGAADVLFEHAGVFAVIGRKDTEAKFLVADGAQSSPVGRRVDFVQELQSARRRAIDDVNVVNVLPAQNQSEPDVPGGLAAGTEDCDAVDVLAAVENKGCGEGGAEGGELLGRKEGVWRTRGGEEG